MKVAKYPPAGRFLGRLAEPDELGPAGESPEPAGEWSRSDFVDDFTPLRKRTLSREYRDLYAKFP